MSSLNSYLALYGPLYVYTTLIIYFVILLCAAIDPRQSPTLYAFYQNNKSHIFGALFFLTIAAMLGTPPSIGFFAKLLSFLVLSFRPDLELVIACVLTLALLIFYLQTIRARGSIRRRLMFRAAETKRSMVLFLIVTQINFYLFVVFLPLLFDILAAYLSK